jgi:hypothetical protein
MTGGRATGADGDAAGSGASSGAGSGDSRPQPRSGGGGGTTAVALVGALALGVLVLGGELPSSIALGGLTGCPSAVRSIVPAVARVPASACSEDGTAAAVAAAQGAVAGRRSGPVHGYPFSVSGFHAVHPCVAADPASPSRPGASSAAALSPPTIGYIVLSSAGSKHRLALQLETWGTAVPPQWFRAYSDVNDTAMRMVTLPTISGRGDYYDAQHRVLRGLQHALATDAAWAAADFVFILGDDTYVVVPELHLFAAQWNPDVPAMFGWMWTKATGTWPGGGSGMLMTRAAAAAIAAALYTDSCPFEGHDDVTLGYCAWRLNIPLVHSPLFDAMGEMFEWVGKPLENPTGMLSAITLHKASAERMAIAHSLFSHVAEASGG